MQMAPNELQMYHCTEYSACNIVFNAMQSLETIVIALYSSTAIQIALSLNTLQFFTAMHGHYLELTLAQIALHWPALRLQRIACLHETPLRVLCYRLGRGKGGLQDGGANLFSASCIPYDAPSALPHTNFVLFNVSVSKNVAVAFLADVLGCTLTVMETKLRPEMSLMVKFARMGGVGGE